MIENKENIILTKSVEFSVKVIKYVEELEKLKKYVIANQLLRSATSIGANIYEAQDAESKLDFIHKMKIAIKEVNETKYWFLLCNKSENYPNCEELSLDLVLIEKLLNKIIATTKLNFKNNTRLQDNEYRNLPNLLINKKETLLTKYETYFYNGLL